MFCDATVTLYYYYLNTYTHTHRLYMYIVYFIICIFLIKHQYMTIRVHYLIECPLRSCSAYFFFFFKEGENALRIPRRRRRLRRGYVGLSNSGIPTKNPLYVHTVHHTCIHDNTISYATLLKRIYIYIHTTKYPYTYHYGC